MRSSYLDYAMSVIVGRALPDVRDGLKPVHRRVLFTMNENGLQPTRPFRKAATTVGDVMGRYHPHGDSPIYDTLVRLAQDFAMRYPLVDAPGQLRVDRQRPAGRLPLHRGPPVAAGDGDAARHRRGHRRLRAQLRRVASGAVGTAGALPQPARQRLVRHRRRHGHQHPAPQPARGDRRSRRLHRRPVDRREGPDEAHQGPGLPDRRHHRRPRGHPRRLRDRPWPGHRSRPRAHRAAAPGQGGDHRHRDALPGLQGRRTWRRQRPDAEDRRAGSERPPQGDLRPPRRVRQAAGSGS